MKKYHSNMSGKKFPIQRIAQYEKAEIPYEFAEEAYSEYVKQFGHAQTLERLGERGGFGVIEIIMLLFWKIRRLEKGEEWTL